MGDKPKAYHYFPDHTERVCYGQGWHYINQCKDCGSVGARSKITVPCPACGGTRIERVIGRWRPRMRRVWWLLWLVRVEVGGRWETKPDTRPDWLAPDAILV